MVTAMVLGVGCKERGERPSTAPPPVAPDSGRAADPPAAKPVAPKTLSPARKTAIVTTLKAMAVRGGCNRVMGCKPAVDLLEYGPDAIAVVGELVATNPRLDKWWLTKAIDVLSQMKSEQAVPLLSGLLTDWRPELRARAALGLARLRFASAHAALVKAQEYWAQNPKESDPGTLGAIAYALHRTARGAQRSATFKDAYLKAWPADRAKVHGTLATIVGILAEVARYWRMSAALPRVRDALEHPSPFARIEAIRAVAVMKDKKAIPSLVGRLDDVQPSQRRAAIAALQAIVGQRDLTSEADWKRWCAAQRCRGANSGL